MDQLCFRIETRETHIKSIPLGFGLRPLAICLHVAAQFTRPNRAAANDCTWISGNAVSLASLYQELLGVLGVLVCAFLVAVKSLPAVSCAKKLRVPELAIWSTSWLAGRNPGHFRW